MTLADYQSSFNGLMVGDATYPMFSLEGVDDFSVRTNDATLPSFWGSQAGGAFTEARTIILGLQMDSSLDVTAPVEAAFVPPGQTDPSALSPFVIKLPDRPELRLMCRVSRRGRVRTPETEISMVRWYFQLDAPDPRLYASEESVTLMTPYAADTTALDLTSGAGVNLAFNMTVSSGTGLAFDFTGVAASGSVAVSNDGTVDTYPSFTFTTTAAMATWHVINDTTLETASFAFALVPGHTVVADMAGVATGSTVLPVTLDGAANYPIWVSPRVPIRLVSGVNVLRFFVDSGTAAGSTATITYRSAWL